MAAVLFLHGLGTGPAAWAPQREALADRATAAPMLPLDVGAAVDVARREADRLGAPADVCGLSLGAIAALRLAAAEPALVRRLVVTAGFARLPRRLAALQLALAAAATVVPARRLVHGLTHELPEAYRADADATLSGVRSRDVARALANAARVDLREAACDIRSPVLVLCGQRDRFNVDLSRDLAARIPGARFAVVPGAGHVANLDNPHAFNELLRAFLDG